MTTKGAYRRHSTPFKLQLCQAMCGHLLRSRNSRAGLESETVVASLKNVAAAGEAVEEFGDHLGIRRPAGVCIHTRRGPEWPVSEFIKDGRRSGIDPSDQFLKTEVEFGQAFGHLSGFAFDLTNGSMRCESGVGQTE